MTIRELPAEEFSRLDGHPALEGYPVPDPTYATAVVAEEGQEIVGLWIVAQVVHLEPVWIAPHLRGSTLLGRLWTAVGSVLDRYRLRMGFCFADRAEISSYLTRLGFTTLPYTVHRFTRT